MGVKNEIWDTSSGLRLRTGSAAVVANGRGEMVTSHA